MTGQIFATLRDGFAPLRLPNVRTYLGGQAISLVGTWMQMTAQAWVVWEISRSSAALGTVTMLGFLPVLLLGPLAGVMADRLDRRRILLASQTVAMAQAFVMAVLVQTGTIALWHVYVLAVLLGTVGAVDFPTQQAFIGDLSGLQDLRKAIVLNTMTFQVSRMLGPVLAGVVIAQFGTPTAFWLNGVSFLAVIGSLLAVRGQQVRHTGRGSPVGDFLEGLRVILRQPRMQDLIVLSILVAFFGISIMTIIPAVAAQALRGGADVLGFLMGASGAGALFGTVVVVPLAQQASRTGLVVGGATVWTGLWIVALSLSHALPLSALAMFLSGATFPVVLTTTNGLIQFMAPQHMRARLVTAMIMVSFGAQPLAAFLVGHSAEAFGALVALRVNGVLMATGALALLLFRADLRRWEPGPRPAGEPEPQPAEMREEAVRV